MNPYSKAKIRIRVSIIEFSENPLSLRDRLHPDVSEMLKSAEQREGKSIKIVLDEDIQDFANATVEGLHPDDLKVTISIASDSESHLDHLVAHELGHVDLFAAAPPSERLIHRINKRELMVARAALRSQLPLGVAGHFRNRADENFQLDVWAAGLISQVYNLPQDMVIERRISTEHPGIREKQAASLARFVTNSRQLLVPLEYYASPQILKEGGLGMDLAFLSEVSDMLPDSSVLRSYKGFRAKSLGKDLLAIFEERSPHDLSGCLAVTRAWSEHLGINSWFHLEELQPSRSNSKR